MLFVQLIYEFFKTGLFSFGGGYATLPFLYHISETYGWFTSKQLSDMIAVSTITPGPLGVNVATFAGFMTSGILGAFIATTAVILPSYIIVIIVFKLLEKFRQNKHVQSAIYALKPAGCGLLTAVGVQIFRENVTNIWAVILFLGLLVLTFKANRDPLIYLGISAVLGIVIGFCHLI